MDISGRLAQANGRLKDANVGIRIEQRGDRLLLRGTFPPRPGSPQSRPHQQRLSLGVRANPAGLKEAENEARKISALIDCREFDWTPYLKQESNPENCSQWVTRLREHYLQEGGTQQTWEGDYWKILKRLPPSVPLTPQVLRELIDGTEPNTKTRKRACMAVGVLAKFAAVEFDPSPLAGKYGPRQVSPRDLPSDQTIREWFDRIKNPGWKWVYGTIATYGLRNHEVFRLDFDQLRLGDPVLKVLEPTKTGARQVWAFYPEWYAEFDIQTVKLPGVNLARNNSQLGHSVTEYFSDLGLPFSVYSLRHCWAVRTIGFGLPDTLAAKQMGHSVAVHTETYHHWITAEVHQRMYEALIASPSRPIPP